MNINKPVQVPEWARNITTVTSNTARPSRWVPCSGCNGTGFQRGCVGGIDMMCSCCLCLGSGGCFEVK